MPQTTRVEQVCSFQGLAPRGEIWKRVTYRQKKNINIATCFTRNMTFQVKLTIKQFNGVLEHKACKNIRCHTYVHSPCAVLPSLFRVLQSLPDTIIPVTTQGKNDVVWDIEGDLTFSALYHIRLPIFSTAKFRLSNGQNQEMGYATRTSIARPISW